jgi:uncharacterized membrane protein
MTLIRNVFAGLLGLTVIQIILYYPQLPHIMASHFDGSGHPNGWMSKNTFFVIHILMVLLMVLCFWRVPWGMTRLPLSWWSLPHRDYWLAPERREHTMRWIQGAMLVMGVVTVVLLLLTIQLAIDANLNPPPVLSDAIGGLLVAYFVSTGVWLVAFFRRFSRAEQ